ncbi:methyltransferase domain-containing protein [Sphaerisporangium dianthi]|uniref:Methyltransferase domain-containing protein n=1 Tax=Sphaerisporangium dianthi TaxID=1436120 RepID=A0ABV9CGU1_9ACTN
MTENIETQTPSDPVDSLIKVLDGVDARPDAVRLRTRSYELLELEPGTAVVDVGCGAGRAVAEMNERGVRAIGVDASERMITVAGRRWPGADVRLGDAFALPLGDGEVRGYRADKVYHEFRDPAGALGEAARVLAPGGRIVLIGQDWDTMVIDSDDPALTRAIVHAKADTVPSPRAARSYRNLLLGAGFRDAEVEVHTAVFTDGMITSMLARLVDGARSSGAITSGQAAGWTAEQAERAQDGRMFVAVPLFVATALRP